MEAHSITREATKEEPNPVQVFDTEKIRKDFPALHQDVNGKPLVYLDNAATSMKPQIVIDVTTNFYARDNSNIHRGVHELSSRATQAYESIRAKLQCFMNAAEARELIFTSGTTDGINLVAQTYGRQHVGEGDEVLITEMEHHSNIVPWQMLCEEKGATLKVAPIDDNGDIILDEFEKLLNEKVKIVAVAHVSNALGTINPIKAIIEMAHRWDIPVLIDGAQGIPHLPIDMRGLDVDFYAWSGHKMFGPTGVGVLYGKAKLLNNMPPYRGGGDMIRSVSFEKTLYNVIPYKFEAGTPNIAGVIGMGEGVEYFCKHSLRSVEQYEQGLIRYALDSLKTIPGLRLIGNPRHRTGAISFLVDDIHPHDIGTILDQEGVAIRAGHHCAQPVMKRFNVPATARASFAFYNTRDEVDILVKAIYKVKEIFGKDV
ncbi:MAG TPA: cysteine desulfurase [bacterium]|jgi:cysteine desulfurase/selenocysteine lyase